MEERLCAVSDVPDGEARRFDLGRTPICVVRVGDGWYGIGDTCTHQNVSLADGEVFTETLEVECWKHGSCFSLVDGQPNALPATRPVPVYELRIDGDDVYVVL